ncbi:hypothetical protein [Streptomyces formicae]|uniref:HTH cro/C1-type domain-containing protein n=1 Tax=Streptomyces formicae TaxID=1616117 RepID=A0ABY3WMI9_9ACTN|nr:hypothetical protein [Streptomyces formicae]UNM13832.1 hypothetical protein J4032_22320 [Streptomyces formicae]
MAALPDRTTSHLQLLATLVTQRRIQLGISSKEKAAERCGLSHMPYRSVEAGKGGTDVTYAKIENGFEVVAGSLRAVAEGNADSIKLIDGTELIAGAQIIRPSLDEIDDEAKQAITIAVALTAPDMTHRQTQELTEQVVKELRRRGILPSGA